ncbi:nipblb [Symbiodinium sp. CCMP2456]|nr:nipblb [Symbiodinium sp. CCMP2456]
MDLLAGETNAFLKGCIEELVKALAKQNALCQRIKDTHRFLLLKCHTEPAINAEHIGMNREILRPLAKAFGKCKELATKPILKLVLHELKDAKSVIIPNKVVGSTASVLKKLLLHTRRLAERSENQRDPKVQKQNQLDFNKPELDRDVKKVQVSLEDDLPRFPLPEPLEEDCKGPEKGSRSSPASDLQAKAYLLAKLKQKLKDRVRTSMSSTFEVSDEEAPAACPLVPVQPAVEVAWKASGTHEHQEEEGIVLTRSMQLALAESRKRFYIMPYWSRGQLGIREGTYTGTQKFSMTGARSMAYNILLANTIVKFLEGSPHLSLFSKEINAIEDELETVQQQTAPSLPDLRLDSNILSLPRTVDVFHKLLSTDRMSLKLPRPGALAGQVIKHGIRVLEDTLASYGPMVYKIGYSYDPHNRFFNRSFGYVHERQKWEKMIVVYVSHETLGPAFLEAALIQRFKGQQGCRNERDGGDTVCAHLDGPFFTYFVYQSFKREPYRAGLSGMD